jgi:hypothetical protein
MTCDLLYQNMKIASRIHVQVGLTGNHHEIIENTCGTMPANVVE